MKDRQGRTKAEQSPDKPRISLEARAELPAILWRRSGQKAAVERRAIARRVQRGQTRMRLPQRDSHQAAPARQHFGFARIKARICSLRPEQIPDYVCGGVTVLFRRKKARQARHIVARCNQPRFTIPARLSLAEANGREEPVANTLPPLGVGELAAFGDILRFRFGRAPVTQCSVCPSISAA
jgi:hypothetical protein